MTISSKKIPLLTTFSGAAELFRESQLLDSNDATPVSNYTPLPYALRGIQDLDGWVDVRPFVRGTIVAWSETESIDYVVEYRRTTNSSEAELVAATTVAAAAESALYEDTLEHIAWIRVTADPTVDDSFGSANVEIYLI